MFLLHKCGFMLKRRGDVKLCKSIEWQCRNNHIIRHDPNCFVQLACVCVCVCVCALTCTGVCTVCPGAGRWTAVAGERTYGCLGLYPLTGVLWAAENSNVLLVMTCVCASVCAVGACVCETVLIQLSPLQLALLLSSPPFWFQFHHVFIVIVRLSLCYCVLGLCLCLSLPPPLSNDTHMSIHWSVCADRLYWFSWLIDGLSD